MKLLILHKSIEDDIILNSSFNDDCIIRYEKDFNSIENLLNSINDMNLISNLAFIYHYPGYCQLPFYDDSVDTQKTYQYFSNNIINLINNLKTKGLETVDLLSCNLNYYNFIQEINQIQTNLGINIRYSLDQTGSNPNGNWILESDNIDVKNLYFTNNIDNWNGVLNSDIGANVRAGNYSSIITYNSTTKIFKVMQNFTWDATTMGVASNFIQLNANEIFDGDGFQITAINNCSGFFTINTTGLNTSNRPIIRNIGVIGGTTSSNVGFIVRNNQNFFIVENCYATGNLPDSSYGSAIAGSYTGSSAIIRSCFHTGYIGYDGGAIVSDHSACLVQNCYSTGNKGSFAGGIAGVYSFNCVIQNCYSYNNNASSGGILGNGSGFAGNQIIQNSYSKGTGVGNSSGVDYYLVPNGHVEVNANYELLTSTYGTVPTNLNSQSTYGSITNSGNAYIADTFGTNGFPLLKSFTEFPWNASSYTQNTNIPTRFSMLISEPIIYRRPLTLSNSVELYWYPPLITNGNQINSYIIECANISYINVVSADSRKSIIKNLVTGNSYVFTIKASNIYGNGNIAAFNFVIPGFKPDFATNLNYVNEISDYSRINFSFNNPVNIGNSAITYNVIKMLPVDISGNILSKSPFIHDHSSLESNIIDPLYDYEYNKNYNYQAYINSINTVNDSNKNYFSTIINPNLPTNGLKLWLDPFDLTTLTFSNSKVTKWEDKSINKANATITESFAPTYDASNALINFNGLQYLNLPANTLPSANSSYSIFTYVSTNNISRNGQWYLYSGSPTANLSLGGFINSNSIVHSWWTNQLSGNSNISTNISYLIENTFDSGIRRTYLNGILIDQDSVSNRNSGTANNLIGTNSNFTGNLVGSIGDIIIYNRILNNFERSSVNNYLERKKYNLSLQNLGNVISWLDASDPNNFYDINNEFKVSYNDYVYNWLDRSYSNNNASQSNIANLPIRRPYIQNNLDVLEFNQSFLTLPIARYPLDAFIVLKLANISDQNGVLGIGPSSNNYSSLSDISGSRWAIDATSNSLIASTTETSSNFLLMEWSIGNNNNYIRRYGSNIVSSNVAAWTLPNNSNIFIGNANGFDFSKKFKGYIGEIMMFNRQLDDSERYPIEGYLAWKWGLQSFLASNHPFKNSAPYLFNKYLIISNNVNTANIISPANIFGLTIWLDASDSANILLSGSNVTQWNNKMSLTNNFSQSTVSKQPIYNSNTRSINFDGVDDSLNGPVYNNVINLGSFYIFMVGTPNSINSNQNNPFDNNAMFGDNGGYQSLFFKTNTVGAYYYDTSNTTKQVTQSYNAGSNTIFGYGVQNSLFNLNVNGNNLTTTSATLPIKNFDGGAVSQFEIGTQYSAWVNTGYLNCSINELLIFNQTLSTYNRQRIEGYLAWKWGLQTNLPNSHPFKLAAPTNTNEFTPLIINDIALWLDANDSSTITLSGSNVLQWNDKSGNGLNVTKNTATSFPTYNTNVLNSKPVVNFTITQYLETTNLNPSSTFTTNSTDTTIFLITRLNGDGINNLTSFGLDTTDNNYVLRSPWSNANKILDIGHRLDFNNNLNNQIVLFSFGRNGTNMFLNNNGSLIGSISNANLSSTVTTLTQKLLIGSGKANGYDGYIAEFIIYKRALSSYEIQRTEGYLAWKWGLQSNLPSTHIFKSAAPTNDFHPRSITGLQLWLDGNDTSTITLSGQSVTQWNDKSGQNNHATGFGNHNATGNLPQLLTNGLNNRTIINLSGANDYFKVNNNFNITSSTYIILVRVLAVPTTQFVRYGIMACDRATFFGYGIGFFGNSTDVNAAYKFEVLSNNTFSNTTLGVDTSGNTWYILTATYNNTTTAVFSSNGTSTNVAIDNQTPDNNDGLKIGIWNTSYAINTSCQVAEAMLYNSALSISDRQKVEGYLAWKWGLQSNLSSNHPYKNAAP